MLWLDAVRSYDDTSVVAVVTVAETNPFVTAHGLPAHAGIELMAQACGAWVGANALAKGEPVRRGFLLGTRRFSARVPWFPLGQELEIAGQVVFMDRNMGVFGCAITTDGKTLAEAQLNVYQPDDGDEMLKAK
jgi:predicted hotdog family 3-hydroxylacyl-ACP dehydratase